MHECLARPQPAALAAAQLTIKRPYDRGYLVNFDLEREIWGRSMRSVLKVNPADVGLLMTEPMFNFPSVRAATEQIVFEELGVSSFYSAPAPVFSMHRAAQLWPSIPANQVGSASRSTCHSATHIR
eukprot:362866-Chlamydomonas_euryale.AAC.36